MHGRLIDELTADSERCCDVDLRTVASLLSKIASKKEVSCLCTAEDSDLLTLYFVRFTSQLY
jgi:hypothetical protein